MSAIWTTDLLEGIGWSSRVDSGHSGDVAQELEGEMFGS
jgi:hypothetical protein